MMIIKRVWAMPNKWTFKILPIAELISRYVGDGKGWVDPFAGQNSPAEITNDLNPDNPAKYHLDAFDFVDVIDGKYNGIIFDPPYSIIQVTRSYADMGLKSKLGFSNNGAIDPTGGFTKVKDKLARHVIPYGLCISCGWNSGGFGKTRGFEIIEVLLVCHGGTHNDTIVTVERKIKNQESMELI
jgi:hypothetical protein